MNRKWMIRLLSLPLLPLATAVFVVALLGTIVWGITEAIAYAWLEKDRS